VHAHRQCISPELLDLLCQLVNKRARSSSVTLQLLRTAENQCTGMA
jgi:hypothetical protein